MAEEKCLMRQVTLHVNTGTIAAPVWTKIGGLAPDLELTTDKTEADTTDQDDGGFPSHYVSTIKRKASVKGRRLEDPDDGSRDAGQEACEATDGVVGLGSRRQFKITSPGGTTLIGTASVNVKPFGGSADEAITWEMELSFSGDWA